MLTKNINILVELNLAHESASVNEIIQEVTRSLKSTTTYIIDKLMAYPKYIKTSIIYGKMPS